MKPKVNRRKKITAEISKIKSEKQKSMGPKAGSTERSTKLINGQNNQN